VPNCYRAALGVTRVGAQIAPWQALNPLESLAIGRGCGPITPPAVRNAKGN